MFIEREKRPSAQRSCKGGIGGVGVIIYAQRREGLYFEACAGLLVPQFNR
jgi:hypothetical protein